jgi:hypothetical protein
MTRFIESFATQQLLPPWRATGARTSGFAIRLTEERIRDYLARYFNGGYPDEAPFHYLPLPGPQFGMLTTCYFPDVCSTSPQAAMHGPSQASWDHLSHREVYLAFPVMRHGVTKDNLLNVAGTVVWVQPFMYSDNDSVVFSSREIWGTDTFLADIVREDGPSPGQLHFDAGMIGIKKFSPRSRSEMLAVLHITAGGVDPLGARERLKANPDLEAFLKTLGVSGAFMEEMQKGVRRSDYPGLEVNNLKQFRDCYDMGQAIYRAIVASKAIHSEIENVVFYDPDKVEIEFMWSDSVAEMLRTLLNAEKPNDTGPPALHDPTGPAGAADKMDWDMDRVVVKAEFGFSFTSNVTFEVISTIHTYGMTS